MQKDEEVLSEVVGHSREPGEAVVRKAEHHHLAGRRTCWLDELERQDGGGNVCEDSRTACPGAVVAHRCLQVLGPCRSF